MSLFCGFAIPPHGFYIVFENAFSIVVMDCQPKLSILFPLLRSAPDLCNGSIRREYG